MQIASTGVYIIYLAHNLIRGGFSTDNNLAELIHSKSASVSKFHITSMPLAPAVNSLENIILYAKV